ncbi:hypothetical protein SNEBB_004446 [Seison nebaliae]|nr:hypothetical protein SNEBB_004446 [Seison nebaliae]
MAEAVKVLVRVRPMNERERSKNCKDIVRMDSQYNQCQLLPIEKNKTAKSFTFDGVYDIKSITETIYEDTASIIVDSVTEGYNGTIFAYGQTGCGKSFTMQGIIKPKTQLGIIPRAFSHIFDKALTTSDGSKYLITVSYLEIYNEKISDLLSLNKNLSLHESPDTGVYVKDLTIHECDSVRSCEKLMDKGWKNRSVGETAMNADSSRSHSIFIITVERSETDGGGEQHFRKGCLNLVDLAGSERQVKTESTGDRFKEATHINFSLSALGNVISALVDGKSKHIPYRDSKLTRLLQNSLGGNTKTLMIAALSPADDNYDETLSTLRYANRAKNIKNKPRINEDPKDAMLREYAEEIEKLKNMLAGKQPVQNDNFEEERERMEIEHEEEVNRLREMMKNEKKGKQELEKQIQKLNSNYEKKMSIINENLPESVEKRLEEIKRHMVGGEEVNNMEKKKHLNMMKNRAKERRDKILNTIRAAENDDELLVNVYDSIQQEAAEKTKALKRAKEKINELRIEARDLQTEFQEEREIFLSDLRESNRKVNLYQNILDRIQPLIRNDCNYSNLDKIKHQAIWDNETESWRLPPVRIEDNSLPKMNSATPLNEHLLVPDNSVHYSNSVQNLHRIKMEESFINEEQNRKLNEKFFNGITPNQDPSQIYRTKSKNLMEMNLVSDINNYHPTYLERSTNPNSKSMKNAKQALGLGGRRRY